MVADALVYHPVIAHYVRFLATSVGRDKVMRTIQFFARFYSWYLFRTNRPQTAIAPYDALKKELGKTRKLIRVGKFVEHIKAASLAMDNKGPVDPVLRYLAVGRQLGYAGYLVIDTYTVVDTIGVRKLAAIKRLQDTAQRAWMAGLLCSAMAGFYTLWNLQGKEKTLDLKEGEGVVEAKKIERERAAARIQLVSDLCDLAMPISALGFANLDEGLIGLTGIVSSLIGLSSQWKRTA
ncbi:hypothetical protein ASPZODRAFT_99564 [Penicilliopsis zonata CBS 506.65]|uniref:Peroxisomal biogenesis factor 11 n=1 Tax=Penicilliopsis zonata CBS 506.65 TaxID=1073090 RepID=A0A1L9SE32_9EURO|nr:hypothetical protein ASPZODRAFT_99564 [Penicilliopsis zonata CBS 506.65]OJJ45466.1 hypothetical protein ASPZODRAFT_99564 [Penicilliopsis zonata CBS 506.65]